MYARQIEGRTLELGVSGKLLDRVLIMWDRETGSEWSHLTGEALAGPLKGEKLEPIADMVMCTLDEWVARHPDTDVLAPVFPIERYRAHEARWAGYFRGKEKERLLGVTVGETARAYPLPALAKAPLVNDSVGETPVLIAYTADTETALAWHRRVGDRVLRFEDAGGEGDARRIRDLETGSTWSPLTGEALSGKLAGERLTAITGIPSYAYGWRTYFPRSSWWKPGEETATPAPADPKRRPRGRVY